MRERLELVTDFGSLRAGERIVDLNCGVCRRPMCKATLDRLDTDTYHFPCFYVVNPCVDNGRKLGVTPMSVAERRIFRVLDDGTQESTATTTKRTRTREKADAE